MTRNTQISSGNFSKGDTSKGNFTGYNAKGEKIFIHKAQMESLGFKKDADVKFPFFAVIGNRDIQTRDEEGNLTNTMVSRLQALSVFKTQNELVNAVNSDAKLAIAAQADLASSAKASGLTDKMVEALLEAAV